MPRPEKVEAVQEIAERFNEASAALLTEYRGLSVADMAELRGALREAGAEYKVLKNTLARIAVREVGLDELVGMLEGPTAIAFTSGDAVDAAKALDNAAKKFPVLIIKGGVLNGQIIDADQAQALAKLESRDVLLTKIAMLLNTPAQQAVNVLAALLRDLGSMLTQVIAQKEAEAPPEIPAESEASGDAAAPSAQTVLEDEGATAPAPSAELAGSGSTPSAPEAAGEHEAAPAEDAETAPEDHEAAPPEDESGASTPSGPEAEAASEESEQTPASEDATDQAPDGGTEPAPAKEEE